MRVLVIDVAAEHGGAKTILEQFISRFSNDVANEYIVLLSKLHYQDLENVKFISYEWVKRSMFHRAFFDRFTMRKAIKTFCPDEILSLQNNAVYAGKIRQAVYFHNALPLSSKRFGFNESSFLWFYQHFIARVINQSLKKANTIIVQTKWMKRQLIEQWHINEKKICVDRIPVPTFDINKNDSRDINQLSFFYPASFALYKNHSNLIRAFASVVKKYGKDIGVNLILTGEESAFPLSLKKVIQEYDLDVRFVGRLNQNEMGRYYSSTNLIFPSYIETVGLPLLEAQQFNAQILCSDLEYSRESIGDYPKVKFFDPFSINSIASSIEAIINIH